MDKDEQILQLTAEKIAIDQSYLNSIREVLNLRKELILKDKAINDLNEQMQKLLNEKVPMQEEIEQLKDKLAIMASHAQH